jgi:hypothetical protein
LFCFFFGAGAYGTKLGVNNGAFKSNFIELRLRPSVLPLFSSLDGEKSTFGALVGTKELLVAFKVGLKLAKLAFIESYYFSGVALFSIYV